MPPSGSNSSLSGVRSLIISPYQTDFKLGDHFSVFNRGPVEKIDRWPELSRPWPAGTTLVFASDSTSKFKDDRRALAWYDLGFKPAKIFFDNTLPDSEETEENSVHIAHAKLQATVLGPWEKLSRSDRAETLKGVNTACPELICVMSEDREVMIDPIIRDHEIFNELRHHSSPLVRAAFASDHEFFGERTKEVMVAAGGPAALLDMVSIATQDLRKRGFLVSSDVTLGVAVCLKPLVPGRLPLPEQGIIIYAREYGCRLKPITEEDRARAEAGHDSDLDHYEIPSAYVTEHRSTDPTIEDLRHIQGADYHDYHSPVAVGLKRFFDLVDAPRRESPKKFGLEDKPNARLLFSNQVGTMNLQYSQLPPKGYQSSSYRAELNNLADLERSIYHCEGVVIGPDPRDWDDPLERTLRKFEQRLLFSYIAALKPHGGFIGTGRPLMIDDGLYTDQLRYFSDFHDQGSVAGLTSDVLSRYRGNTDLYEQLRGGRWDPESFKPNPAIAPDMPLMDEQELCRLLEIDSLDDLGFTWTGLGSASNMIDSGLQDTRRFSYLAAKAGMTCFSGGGVRAPMRELFMGHITAYRDGARDFRKIGVRVPVVSRHEGDMREFVQQQGLALVKGDIEGRHFRTLGGLVDVVETDHMAQRQHLLYMASRAGVYFIHGIGGDYEANSNAYHNLRLLKDGQGIFPGSELNGVAKPMFVVNSEVRNGRTYGYFDKYLEFITPEEREMIHMSVHKTPDEAFRAVRSFGRGLGYDIPDSEKTRVFVPRGPDLAQ